MKKLLLVVSFLSIPALAEDVPATEAQSIKSYEMADIEHQSANLDGKIVKIKFNARSGGTKKADGSLAGELIYSSGKQFQAAGKQGMAALGKKSGSLSVIVPEEAADWYMHLPMESSDTLKSLIVYGRVKAGSYRPTVTLLGREMKTDAQGCHIVWTTATVAPSPFAH